MITYKCDHSESNPIIKGYTTKDAPVVVYLYPKHRSYGSKATITDGHNRSISYLMITDYTKKYALSSVTLDVNANNSQSQGNVQSTYMKNRRTVESGNEI